MTKRTKISAVLALILVASLAGGIWWFKHRVSSALAPAQEADEVSKRYQLWTVKLSGSNEMSNCKGKFSISGNMEILFPAEFADLLKKDLKSSSADKSAENQNIKGEAGFSSVIKPDDDSTKDGTFLLASRTNEVPSTAQASWVTLEGKRKLQVIVSATQSKELMVSNCMIKGKMASPSIFAVILRGELGPTGISGEWAAVNGNAPEDHSHGEFQMALKAGVGSANSISGPGELKLLYAEDAAHLSWTASPAMHSFKAYVSQGTELDKKTATQKQIATNFFDVSGIPPHSAYAFGVTALMGNVESKISDVVVGVMGEPLVASQIAVGDNHACAIVSGGEVICWGQNKFGQLGNGKVGLRGIAVPVPKITTAKAISAGTDFTCVVLMDGHVQCWGKNDNGELGFDPKPGSYGPLEVPDTIAVDIRSRGHHTCATLAGELVKCWGTGVTEGPKSPVLRMRSVVQTNHLACALNSNKEVWCWNITGSEPKRMAAEIEEFSANDEVVCAVNGNHRVKCWADLTAASQLDGLAATAEQFADTLHLSMNNRFACAIKPDDSVFCWGKNDRGQLGLENLTQSQIALSSQISKFKPKGAVHLGADFACDLNADSHVYCWGSNEFGQLGNGVGQYSPTPQLVLK